MDYHKAIEYLVLRADERGAAALATIEATVANLRAALKPFAEKCPDDPRLSRHQDHPVKITVRLNHLRQARALLEGEDAADAVENP